MIIDRKHRGKSDEIRSVQTDDGLLSISATGLERVNRLRAKQTHNSYTMIPRLQ